jgi:hypothetical protein
LIDPVTLRARIQSVLRRGNFAATVHLSEAHGRLITGTPFAPAQNQLVRVGRYHPTASRNVLTPRAMRNEATTLPS